MVFSGGPQLLKDYLASGDSNSCSSSGFRSFPRRLQHQQKQHHRSTTTTQTVRTLLQIDLNTTTTITNNTSSPGLKLTRSRSKALRFFSNAVRFFPPFHNLKSKRQEYDVGVCLIRGAPGPFKVKDILRWKSFRDLVEEDSPAPLNFYDVGATTSTGSASNSSSSSRSSSTSATSWCDSDFTAEEFPSWGGNSCDYSEGKRFSPQLGVGGDRDSTVDPKGDSSCEEKEQNSPVSVLNFPIQEDEQSFSPFNQCLQNLERRKHMLLKDLEHFEHLSTKLGRPTTIEDKYLDEDCKEYHGDNNDNKCVQKGDGNEEKARQMLSHVRTNSSLGTREASVAQLLLDFFSSELATSRKQNDARFDCGILRVAKDWVSGKYEESFDWEMEGKREAYVRDMERGDRWKKFEEERGDLAMEVEAWLFDNLVDELVVDVSCSFKTQED